MLLLTLLRQPAGELEDSRTAESITHGAGLSSEQTERLLLPAGVTSCGVEILREGLQDMVLEGANETRELSSVSGTSSLALVRQL